MPFLTNAVVEALPLPDKGQKLHWDSGKGSVSGFGVRVTANGAKSYIVQGRVNGKSVRYTIGPCDRLDSGKPVNVPKLTGAKCWTARIPIPSANADRHKD